jgi:hypothetical protein
MVAVREIPWEEASAPGFETTTRQAWRAAVAEIAEKAKVKLPECAGRVDSAVKIVLAGDVTLLADDTAKVASQSNSSAAYHVVNGACSCKDFAKAPHQFCKHRLSAAIMRRAQELVKQRLEQPNGASNDTSKSPAEQSQTQGEAVSTLPEAPVSITLKATLHGHEVMVTLRGVDFASVKAQVEQASQWLKLQAPAQSQPAKTEQGWCGKHGVVMKLNHGKNGSTWWSHHTAEGWCKGK